MDCVAIHDCPIQIALAACSAFEQPIPPTLLANWAQCNKTGGHQGHCDVEQGSPDVDWHRWLSLLLLGLAGMGIGENCVLSGVLFRQMLRGRVAFLHHLVIVVLNIWLVGSLVGLGLRLWTKGSAAICAGLGSTWELQLGLESALTAAAAAQVFLVASGLVRIRWMRHPRQYRRISHPWSVAMNGLIGLAVGFSSARMVGPSRFLRWGWEAMDREELFCRLVKNQTSALPKTFPPSSLGAFGAHCNVGLGWDASPLQTGGLVTIMTAFVVLTAVFAAAVHAFKNLRRQVDPVVFQERPDDESSIGEEKPQRRSRYYETPTAHESLLTIGWLLETTLGLGRNVLAMAALWAEVWGGSSADWVMVRRLLWYLAVSSFFLHLLLPTLAFLAVSASMRRELIYLMPCFWRRRRRNQALKYNVESDCVSGLPQDSRRLPELHCPTRAPR